MKAKKLFLMAAMLLTSLCAFAQGENNEPLKGDVNGDGKVDVADITAIIAIIMNNTSQTTYYWYVGPTTPSSIGTIVSSSEEIGWHNFTNGTTSLSVGQVVNETKVNWVVLVPASSGLHNVVDAGEILLDYTVSTITIDGVSYTKIEQIEPSKRFGQYYIE